MGPFCLDEDKTETTTDAHIFSFLPLIRAYVCSLSSFLLVSICSFLSFLFYLSFSAVVVFAWLRFFSSPLLLLSSYLLLICVSFAFLCFFSYPFSCRAHDERAGEEMDEGSNGVGDARSCEVKARHQKNTNHLCRMAPAEHPCGESDECAEADFMS